MQYTIHQLIFFFFVYSFLGWIFDMTAEAIRYGKVANRGFLNGPLCVHYGIIMIVVLLDINDLWEHPLYQLITCMVIVFVTEYVSGAMLKKITGRRFWDYSHLKFNIGGYTCAFSIVGWGLAAAATAWLIHPLVCIIYALIPLSIIKILEIAAIVIFLIDLFVTAATMLKWHFSGGIYGNVAKTLEKTKIHLGQKTFQWVSKRMYKAFPELEGQEKNDEVGFGKTKDRVFAKGLCFDKLVWIFFVSALLGDWVETVFVWLTAGEFMSRSSLLYGTFSIVWGLGGALATALLYPVKDKNPLIIFAGGFVLGGVYEYSCSVFTEYVFGTVFWDYSHLPYNINGRVNLLFCVYWGVAAIAWVKLIYPAASFLLEKIPPVAGKIMTWIIVVFMVLNMAVSGAAISRYVSRKSGVEASTPIEHLCDSIYSDKFIERIYPNMRIQ